MSRPQIGLGVSPADRVEDVGIEGPKAPTKIGSPCMIECMKYFSHKAITGIHLQRVPRCLGRAPICRLDKTVSCSATFLELLQVTAWRDRRGGVDDSRDDGFVGCGRLCYVRSRYNWWFLNERTTRIKQLLLLALGNGWAGKKDVAETPTISMVRLRASYSLAVRHTGRDVRALVVSQACSKSVVICDTLGRFPHGPTYGVKIAAP